MAFPNFKTNCSASFKWSINGVKSLSLRSDSMETASTMTRDCLRWFGPANIPWAAALSTKARSEDSEDTKKRKMSEDPDGTAGKTCSWHLHLDFEATSCYSTCGHKCSLWKVRGRGQTRVFLALKRLMPKLSMEYQISMKRVLSNLLTLDTYFHLLAFNPRILFLQSKTLPF